MDLHNFSPQSLAIWLQPCRNFFCKKMHMEEKVGLCNRFIVSAVALSA